MSLVGQVDDRFAAQRDLDRGPAAQFDVLPKVESHVPTERVLGALLLRRPEQHGEKLAFWFANPDLHVGMIAERLHRARRRLGQVGVERRHVDVELDGAVIRFRVQQQRAPRLAERDSLERHGNRLLFAPP